MFKLVEVFKLFCLLVLLVLVVVLLLLGLGLVLELVELVIELGLALAVFELCFVVAAVVVLGASVVPYLEFVVVVAAAVPSSVSMRYSPPVEVYHRVPWRVASFAKAREVSVACGAESQCLSEWRQKSSQAPPSVCSAFRDRPPASHSSQFQNSLERCSPACPAECCECDLLKRVRKGEKSSTGCALTHPSQCCAQRQHKTLARRAVVCPFQCCAEARDESNPRQWLVSQTGESGCPVRQACQMPRASPQKTWECERSSISICDKPGALPCSGRLFW